MRLTVIFTNPAPIALFNEPCTHRRVTIELTEQQKKSLMPKKTGASSGAEIHDYPSLFVLEYDQHEGLSSNKMGG